jgi:hypothetical protein
VERNEGVIAPYNISSEIEVQKGQKIGSFVNLDAVKRSARLRGVDKQLNGKKRIISNAKQHLYQQHTIYNSSNYFQY